MDETTSELLIDLNRKFYQTFALEFSATRQRLQPGVISIIEQVSDGDNLLDLGCGNGQFARELFNRDHLGSYTGLDSNSELLRIARENLPENEKIKLLHRDLSTTNWSDDLPVDHYDLIIAFAVLHHIPSYLLRKQILQKIADLSLPGARFIHSEWQFLNSPRLKSRIQSWESIGINSDEVEDGDYLVDWRAGGQGLRYVHMFDISELEMLAGETGFEVMDSFHSDGEGGKLGLYQVWKRL